MGDQNTDIFAAAIQSGMTASGLQTGTPTVKASDVPSTTPVAAPAKVDTTPPQITTEPVKPQDTPTIEPEDKVSLDDFKDVLGKLDKPTPDVKVTKPTEVPTQLPSREVQLKELGIEPTKFEIFRKMSNDAFAETVSLIKAQKESQAKLTEYETKVKEFENSKGKLPSSYYEHPEGYLLHPEVKKAVSENQMVQKELAHWEKQFQAIEAGEEWEDMDYDNKGNPVYKKMQSNTQAKLAVLGYIQNARGILNQNSQYLQNVSTQWQQMHQQYVGTFASAADQYFPQYKGKADNQYINTMNKLMTERGQGHNPLLPIFSRMYASLMETNAQLNALKAAAPKAQPQQPPSSILNGGGNTDGSSDDMVSIKEFENVLNRR